LGHLIDRHFRRDGQQGMLDYDSTDLYYHKEFSELLSAALVFLFPLRPFLLIRLVSVLPPPSGAL